MKKFLVALLAAAILCSCDNQAGFFSALLQSIGNAIVDEGETTLQTQPALMELPTIEDDDIIITHIGYTISYNAEARIPEWVAYELTADETRGESGRDDAMFQMDPDYRSTQAMREDYSGSGWTKGHMACAGDFHWDSDALGETFYLTNVCPQDETLNQGDWNYLERQVRNWARDYGKVWVVTGPIIGTGKYGVIGDRDVVVPDSFFKAVMYQNKGKFHSIAFVMGNDSARYYLNDCCMSVNELEELTGLDFFPMLDDSVEESVESQLHPSDWGIRQR